MAARTQLLQLADDLRAELGAVERIVEEAARYCGQFATVAPSPLELRGVGDVVHDFYNAVEHFLVRVSVEMNGAAPTGPDSHARLLDRMARELPGVRPAVLGTNVRRELDEYLRFRHLFRHGYGFALDWPRLQPLLSGIARLAPRLREDFGGFIRAVEQLADRVK